MAYSPNGKILASGNGGRIKLWDTTGRENIHTLEGHSTDLVTYGHGNYGGQYIPAVKSVSFSPNGKILASGSQDKTVMLWDVTKGKHLATLKQHASGVDCVAFSRTGRFWPQRVKTRQSDYGTFPGLGIEKDFWRLVSRSFSRLPRCRAGDQFWMSGTFAEPVLNVLYFRAS